MTRTVLSWNVPVGDTTSTGARKRSAKERRLSLVIADVFPGGETEDGALLPLALTVNVGEESRTRPGTGTNTIPARALDLTCVTVTASRLREGL